jgi:riboflavin transporter FmnP
MRYIVALKTVLVSLVFGIAGMGIELALHRTLLELILVSFGIAKVGLNADFIELGCVVVLFALVCGGNAYLAASATRKIPARSLVVE